jgi:hypothetical protein
LNVKFARHTRVTALTEASDRVATTQVCKAAVRFLSPSKDEWNEEEMRFALAVK